MRWADGSPADAAGVNFCGSRDSGSRTGFRRFEFLLNPKARPPDPRWSRTSLAQEESAPERVRVAETLRGFPSPSIRPVRRTRAAVDRGSTLRLRSASAGRRADAPAGLEGPLRLPADTVALCAADIIAADRLRAASTAADHVPFRPHQSAVQTAEQHGRHWVAYLLTQGRLRRSCGLLRRPSAAAILRSSAVHPGRPSNLRRSRMIPADGLLYRLGHPTLSGMQSGRAQNHPCHHPPSAQGPLQPGCGPVLHLYLRLPRPVPVALLLTGQS